MENIKPIAKAFEENEVLVHLDLSHNRITEFEA
jgi:hypothetical protein